ncbi:MAG: lytic transglycosylase domain-containing protein [Bacteroidetes bacterium]|nr:lytic transglycosylase domain-containing protein [Rhodothermia bacterium]MCX7907054.1 lytic transglycosylase domain-containing protein [Bacteroidota bacterium]MDW8285464.1 lytic transglycosylase domain-containing protein [Bacteroidota bacterium]
MRLNRTFELFSRRKARYFVGCLLGVSLLGAGWWAGYRQSSTARGPDLAWQPFRALLLPDSLSFCGEPVPLKDPEVRERFERELYLLVYRPFQVFFHIKRSARYFRYIEAELRSRGLPEDLKYLAVAESDLLPQAISPAGAAGLWQFMPDVARQFGLRVDEAVDERLHLRKSTQAALRYLDQLYRRFGSWHLAGAAYNLGPGRLEALIRQQGTRSYYELWLADETARYVLKAAAVKAIFEQPHRFGFDLSGLEPYPEYPTRTVLVEGPVADLAAWCRQQGLSYRLVRLLNPWIRRPELPVGRFELDIPASG